MVDYEPLFTGYQQVVVRVMKVENRTSSRSVAAVTLGLIACLGDVAACAQVYKPNAALPQPLVFAHGQPQRYQLTGRTSLIDPRVRAHPDLLTQPVDRVGAGVPIDPACEKNQLQ